MWNQIVYVDLNILDTELLLQQHHDPYMVKYRKYLLEV